MDKKIISLNYVRKTFILDLIPIIPLVFEFPYR